MSEEELGFAPYAKPGEKLILADALAAEPSWMVRRSLPGQTS
jgi:hypothetical protein